MMRDWTIGTNTFRFEPPDVLWVKIEGNCSLEEAVLISRLYRELAAVRPFYALNDMQTSTGMDAEARHYMSENVRFEWFRAMIFFNTRLMHRALAQGLVLATTMTREEEEDETPPMDVHFVPTREDALALLARLRAREDDHSAQNWK
jgi:hypothetical protein